MGPIPTGGNQSPGASYRRAMLRATLLLSLSLLAGCANVRSIWRDLGNEDLAGREAPGWVDGEWLLPPDDDELAREAPPDWQPAKSRFWLVAFLQPH